MIILKPKLKAFFIYVSKSLIISTNKSRTCSRMFYQHRHIYINYIKTIKVICNHNILIQIIIDRAVWRVIMILVFRKTNEWLCDEQNTDELQEQHRDCFDTCNVWRRKRAVNSQPAGGGSFKNTAGSWKMQLTAV